MTNVHDDCDEVTSEFSLTSWNLRKDWTDVNYYVGTWKHENHIQNIYDSTAYSCSDCHHITLTWCIVESVTMRVLRVELCVCRHRGSINHS